MARVAALRVATFGVGVAFVRSLCTFVNVYKKQAKEAKRKREERNLSGGIEFHSKVLSDSEREPNRVHWKERESGLKKAR